MVQGSGSLAVLLLPPCSLAPVCLCPLTQSHGHPPPPPPPPYRRRAGHPLHLELPVDAHLLQSAPSQRSRSFTLAILVYFQSQRRNTAQMQTGFYTVKSAKPDVCCSPLSHLMLFSRSGTEMSSRWLFCIVCRKQNSTAPPLENPAREPTSSSPSRVSPHPVALSNTIAWFLLKKQKKKKKKKSIVKKKKIALHECTFCRCRHI